MKTGIIGLVIVVLIASAGAIFFLSPSEKPTQQTIPTQSEDTLTIDDIKTIDSDTSESKYVELSDTKYPGPLTRKLANSDTLKRVYFFYADWCPTCRPVDAEIKSNLNKIPDDVLIIKVNYNDQYTDDEEKAFAQLHKVTYQHTFVQVDKEGNEITKWNGGGLDNLLSKIK